MEKVTIMDVAAEGKAIAKVNDLVIFVPYVVPGDVVDLQIKRKKNKYAEAEAVKFHELSPNRAVPFCQHYGVCGGCKWQVLPYSEQIRYKQKQVEDNLRRIGKDRTSRDFADSRFRKDGILQEQTGIYLLQQTLVDERRSSSGCEV